MRALLANTQLNVGHFPMATILSITCWSNSLYKYRKAERAEQYMYMYLRLRIYQVTTGEAEIVKAVDE